jgi:hypothetical protein
VAVLFQVAVPDVRSSGGGFGRGIFSVRVSVVAGILMRRRPSHAEAEIHMSAMSRVGHAALADFRSSPG